MKFKIFIMLIIGLLALSGCDKKKTNKSTPARTARTVPPIPHQQGNPNQQPPNNGYNTGSQWVYLQSSDYNSFYQSLQGFVSASMNPQELGNVSNYGDVALIGYIDMDSQGNINTANSRLRIEIWDDYARSGSASEIAVAFNNLSSYSFNGNQLNLVFQDSYGQVVVSGQLTNQDFYGTVSYYNNASYDGYSGGASGTLGNFQVPYCGFFRCQ